VQNGSKSWLVRYSQDNERSQAIQNIPKDFDRSFAERSIASDYKELWSFVSLETAEPTKGIIELDLIFKTMELQGTHVEVEVGHYEMTAFSKTIHNTRKSLRGRMNFPSTQSLVDFTPALIRITSSSSRQNSGAMLVKTDVR
jgi:hypothetical protein